MMPLIWNWLCAGAYRWHRWTTGLRKLRRQSGSRNISRKHVRNERGQPLRTGPSSFKHLVTILSLGSTPGGDRTDTPLRTRGFSRPSHESLEQSRASANSATGAHVSILGRSASDSATFPMIHRGRTSQDKASTNTHFVNESLRFTSNIPAEFGDPSLLQTASNLICQIPQSDRFTKQLTTSEPIENRSNDHAAYQPGAYVAAPAGTQGVPPIHRNAPWPLPLL